MKEPKTLEKCPNCDAPRKVNENAYSCGTIVWEPFNKRSEFCITKSVLREFSKSCDSLFGQLKSAVDLLHRFGLKRDDYLSLECCEEPRGMAGSACSSCGGMVLQDWDAIKKEEIAVFRD